MPLPRKTASPADTSAMSTKVSVSQLPLVVADKAARQIYWTAGESYVHLLTPCCAASSAYADSDNRSLSNECTTSAVDSRCINRIQFCCSCTGAVTGTTQGVLRGLNVVRVSPCQTRLETAEEAVCICFTHKASCQLQQRVALLSTGG